MKHPKTTVLGILTIIGGGVTLGIAFLNGHLDSTALATFGAALTAGLGLIKAADGNNV